MSGQPYRHGQAGRGERVRRRSARDGAPDAGEHARHGAAAGRGAGGDEAGGAEHRGRLQLLRQRRRTEEQRKTGDAPAPSLQGPPAIPTVGGVFVQLPRVLVRETSSDCRGSCLFSQPAGAATHVRGQLLEGAAKLLACPEQQSSGCVRRHAENGPDLAGTQPADVVKAEHGLVVERQHLE